jgi:hypothetical protein
MGGLRPESQDNTGRRKQWAEIQRTCFAPLLLKPSLARGWWLPPVILATQETDQEDRGSKSNWANSSQDPISKKHHKKKKKKKKKGWWSGSR